MSEIRRRAMAGLKQGETFTATRTFTRDDTVRFGELTQDYNPVHYEPAFARAKGYSQPILHGLLTGGLLCEIGGQIGWLATGMDFHFKRPVYPGDTITCTLTIAEAADAGRRARATAVYTNQHGDVVVEALLTGQLPGPEEQQVLAQMLERGDPTNKLFDPSAS